MKKETTDIFNVIKDALAVKKMPNDFYISQEVAKKLFITLKKHAMGHLLDGVLDCVDSREVEPKTRKIIRDSFLSALNSDARKTKALNDISESFEENQIDYMPLKWANVKELYPATWMRTSSDIDILVRQKDIQKATVLLLGLGYKKGIEWKNDISFFLDEKVHVELHYRLLENEAIIDDAFKYAYVLANTHHHYVMKPEYEYLYHVAHMAKHFVEKGCGIRFFIDLWLLNKKRDIDFDKVNELLLDANLKTFGEKSLKLSKMWLEEEPHPELEKFSDFVLDSAIYGTSKQYVLIKRQNAGKFFYLKKRLFLPYSVLSRLYPSLKGKRVLTPIYEVKRIIAILGNKNSNKWKELKTNNAASQNEIKETSELMKMLGI